MERSVQPLLAVRSPDLRVIETARLLLHEEPDPVRVDRLTRSLQRDGVLRNPAMVAQAPEQHAVVLDGANRITALRTLGIPHAVVQVVPYGSPEVSLSTWRHYIRDDGRPSLSEAVAALDGVRVIPATDAREAEGRLARRDAVAAIIDGRVAALIGRLGDIVADANTLNRIVALYRGTGRIYRVDSGDAEALSGAYGPGTLVIFPPFGKDEILLIAARGGRLPTGITRHIIPGRALRLNVPLSVLAGPEGAAAKQRHLDATLQERWLEHGVRYYAEPTYLFDE